MEKPAAAAEAQLVFERIANKKKNDPTGIRLLEMGSHDSKNHLLSNAKTYGSPKPKYCPAVEKHYGTWIKKATHVHTLKKQIRKQNEKSVFVPISHCGIMKRILITRNLLASFPEEDKSIIASRH